MIAESFHAAPVLAELPMSGADYNVAPTIFQPITRQSRESGEREIVLARWGDSMRNAGILDGDLLVVDRSAKPANGCVVVVAVNGEYTVKRLRRGPDCVWLEAANPRYQPTLRFGG